MFWSLPPSRIVLNSVEGIEPVSASELGPLKSTSVWVL